MHTGLAAGLPRSFGSMCAWPLPLLLHAVQGYKRLLNVLSLVYGPRSLGLHQGVYMCHLAMCGYLLGKERLHTFLHVKAEAQVGAEKGYLISEPIQAGFSGGPSLIQFCSHKCSRVRQR